MRISDWSSDVCSSGSQRALELIGVEAAIGGARFAADAIKLRPFRADGHGAARGVLSEQCALGAAKHFELRDVEGVEKLGLDRRHHEVVEKHADRRFIRAEEERKGVG